MAKGFFNMFVKIILLISILSDIVYVDGVQFPDFESWAPFVGNANRLFAIPLKKVDRCTSENRLDGKTVIVTGSSSGIGEATVLELYKRGAEVIMACRNVDKTYKAMDRIKKVANDEFNKNLKGRKFGSLEYHNLDLSDLNSVRVSAEKLLERTKDIHILVNNAGIFTPKKMFSKDGIELHLAINHLGHFLFTLLLLPRIQMSGPARIINVTSNAYRWGDMKLHLDDINLTETRFRPIRVYGRSKLANILFTVELAKRLNAIKGNKVMVYAPFPGGFTNTTISRYMEPFVKLFYNIFTYYTQLKTRDAAQTILYCVLDDKCAKETGLYYNNCKSEETKPEANDQTVSKQLWDKSCELVHLTNNEDPFNGDTLI